MRRRLALAAPIAAVLAAAPPPSSAHPHVFVDAELRFLLDDAGALTGLRVAWAFDAFYSMLLLAELGIDQAAPLSEEARATLAALQPDWARDFGGEGTAAYDETPLALGAATEVTAALDDGRLRIAFTRPLPQPVDPSAGAVKAEVYDPAFFVAYTLAEPEISGDGAGDCSAVLRPFVPSAETDALQTALMALGMDETPETPGVGRVFADTAALTCR